MNSEQQLRERARLQLLGIVGSHTKVESNSFELDGSQARAIEEDLTKLVRQRLSRPQLKKKGLSRLTKKALGFSALVAILFIAAFTTQSVIARQQLRQGGEFARAFMQFGMELFQEDLSVCSRLATRAEVVLRPSSAWNNTSDTVQRMYACPQALQALTSIRMGFPEDGLSQLENATKMLQIEPLSLAPRSDNFINSDQLQLEFVFQLVAGKASLEARQMLVSRFMTSQSRSIYEFDRRIVQHLEQALKLLDSGMMNGTSSDRQTLLKAAILTDLGRTYLKTTVSTGDSNTTTASQTLFSNARRCFDRARNELNSVQVLDDQFYGQYLRMLNNEILFYNRLTSYRLDPSEFLKYREQLQMQMVDAVAKVDGSNTDDIRFELAVCYSNYADFLDDGYSVMGDTLGQLPSDEVLLLRNRSVELLLQIFERSRTERCNENILLNRGRSIRLQLLNMIKNSSETKSMVSAPPTSLVEIARRLSDQTGNRILDVQFGQLDHLSRFCTAILVPEKYTTAELNQFMENHAATEGTTELRATMTAILQKMVMVTEPAKPQNPF